MTIQFDDLLSAICSRVKPAHATDFQKVYSLSTELEAKLAFDILVAYGFDVKVYHQPDKMSKLYITNPTLSPEKLEQVLSLALIYTKTLKRIKQDLDALCSENPPVPNSVQYSMTFANSHPNGKQILIQIMPAKAADVMAAQAAAATDIVSSVAPDASQQPAIQLVSTQPVKKVITAKAHYSELSAGPEVGRRSYPGKLEADGTAQHNTLKRRILFYIFGNMETSLFAMFVQILIFGIIFSLFVFAKAVVCPDFAYYRSNAWYCRTSTVSNADQEKQVQEERQRKIGLQPTQPSPNNR